jgi:hypothetical protein
MAWIIAEEKIVGTVGIAATPPPAYTPTPPVPKLAPVTYEEVLRKHTLIREKIDARASKGECITAHAIAKELELPIDVVETHIKILQSDKYVVPTDKEDVSRICSREALNRLYESLGRLIFHKD